MSLILKRSLSMSTNAVSRLIRPPTQVHGVEGRYASALYSAAHKRNTLEQVEKDLQKDFILNPSLKRTKKKELVISMAQKLGLTRETVNFLGLLAENGRLNKLESVVSSYDAIMRAHKGELSVQVMSSEPLSKSHESALNDALNKVAKTDQKLNVIYTVKPSLIGGLVVTIGDKYVDLSIASRMKKLKESVAKTDQKLNVIYTVKPSLIGGLVVTIGDKYVDLSIASRMKKLKESVISSV
ncbi:ATP synthase F1, delta subunit [Dictyocaulus viviparus]|uniref:Oligomycin sensitivity conferral protein n=1 Tax=Dictyocaulus viviparus TaxID=29172 RepID=A0A0D8Y508_DICVI|nr:ATP synthase F1, delta subunit [Dictyocaulus viviparus]